MYKYLTLGIFILIALPSFSQDKFRSLDKFIEEEMQHWNIPNVAIAIVNKDSLLFEKEYGKDNSKGNYLIGSVGKSFTALAVMQLDEKGVVSIDRPVNSYLPWFILQNKTITDKVTIRHLLNQTSGFPKSAGFYTPQSKVQSEVEADYQKYLQSITIDEEAIGETHVYCNLNYQILGQLIQKVSGKSYGEYVKQNIFIPAGMQTSFASYEESAKAGLKNGYQYLFGLTMQRTLMYNNNGLGAGDIASNANDMGKFLRVLLKNGVGATGTLIDSAHLKEMHTPFSNRYGMGFSIGDWNGLHSVRHTGLSKNYSSAINILPQENYGIVILTNINSLYAARILMDGVIRRLAKQESDNYVPYEIYFRYLIFLLILWSLTDLSLKIRKWKKQGFNVLASTAFKPLSKLVLSLFLAGIWLVIVPHFGNIPLMKMPALQPDLGYGLIGGAIIGVCAAVVQYFINSNVISNKTKGVHT